MPQKLFLSYARSDDKAFVANLYADLQKAGHDVWYDIERMPNRGLTFLEAIRDEIDACDRFLLVLGPGALLSDYVRSEWQHALVFAKAVIPLLRIGKIDDLPVELKLPDIVNFSEAEGRPTYEEAVNKLLRQLAEPVLPIGPLLTSVPVLPLHFVQRTHVLNRLELLVKGDGLQPIVISGAKQAVALVGMGGLGKSVQAAALARSAQARRFFRDGIVWIEVGEKGQLIDAARTLLSVFGRPDWNASWSQIRVELPAAIGNRICLIVLDDVWTAGDLRIIQGALGNSGRLLVTTRFPELAEDMDAPVVEQLDQMNETEAIALLASWVEKESSLLPPTAREVARECGYLPLALALCGAMARELSWQHILQGLSTANARLLSKAFAAMETSLTWLRTKDQEAAALYTTLSIFPADKPIPVAAIVSFWQGRCPYDEVTIRFILAGLQGKALLQLHGAKQPETTGKGEGFHHVSLHDLQYDYLGHINLGRKKELHAELLNAYAAVCNGNWTDLPRDGYILEHLGHHLAEAGRLKEMETLLLDFSWLYRQLTETGIDALFRDFDRVSSKAPLALLRHALYQSAPVISRDPKQLAGQLLGRLGATKESMLQPILVQAKCWRGAAWLRPVFPSLLPPNAAHSMILTGHEGTVRSVAFSHDSRILASAGNSGPDRTIRLWDLYSGTELHCLIGEAVPGGRTPMAFTYGSRELITAFGMELRVWDWRKGVLKRRLNEHDAQIGMIMPAYSANRLFTTAGNKGFVWDTDSWKVLYTFQITEGMLSIAFSPGGDKIACAFENQIVLLKWETEKLTEVKMSIGQHCELWFSANGKELLWRNEKGPLYSLDIQNQTNSILMEDCPTDDHIYIDAPSGLLLSKPDDHNRFPALYSFRSSKFLGCLQISSNDNPQDRLPSCLALSPSGELAILCDYQHRIEVWNTSKIQEKPEDEAQRAVAFQFTNDSTFLWVQPGAGDKGILLALADGQQFENPSLANTIFTNLIDRSEKASASKEMAWNDGWVFLDQHDKGELYAERTMGKGAEFEEPDQPAIGYNGRAVQFRDTDKSTERMFKGHTLRICAGIIFPNGKRAATAGYGRVIRVWDLEAEKEVFILRGHTDIIFGLAVSGDDRWLLSCGNDRTARVWDMDNGHLVATYTSDRPLDQAAVSPDGKWFAVAKGPIGRIHLLQLLQPDDSTT